MTAISIIIALVFEKQIQAFIEHKNGRILKLAASALAILSVFLAIVFVYALLNFLIIATSFLNSILNVGNNYGTVFYVLGSLILAMKPFFSNITNERFDNLWTLKELVVAAIFFLLGGIYNNFYL